VSRTSISVSESTKEMLERLKTADESYDDLLVRLVGEEEPVNIGAWSDEEAEQAREAIRRNRERTQ
jgi:predicted CopG family antitoxin